MAGQFALQPGISMTHIATAATSVRLHANPPVNYAGAISTSMGLRSFVANSGFFSLTGAQVLTTPQFSGKTLAGGMVSWFSVCDDTGSVLLAVGPLPAPTVLNASQDNWLLSIAATANLGAPTLTSP
jgi:hypothetical protein